MSFEGGLLVISGERPLKTLRVWQGWAPPPSFICCAGELFLQSKTNHLPTLPTLTSTPSLNALYGFPLVMKMEIRDSSQIFSPQNPFSCCLIISDRNIWRSPAAQFHFWFTVGYKLNTGYCRGQIYKNYCNLSILHRQEMNKIVEHHPQISTQIFLDDTITPCQTDVAAKAISGWKYGWNGMDISGLGEIKSS